MTPFFVTCIFIGFIIDVNPYVYRNLTCGIDKSRTSVLYEGVADIDTYPWLGTLFYPIGKKKATTSVVLVTKQIVIGSANEIDMLPKENVRSHSRVVLGYNCSGPSIKIRDYTFHPDYKINSYSALAMVQLEVDLILQELRPICAPPTYFIQPQFYAMTPGDCSKGKVRIYKMRYVPKEQCKRFYRKSGQDTGKYWPTHTACARAVSGTSCKWRSGTVLVVKQDGRWRLLGFGLHGPGCQSPARFLDYGMHQQWVRNNVAKIGMPAITRVGENHLIMRRSLGNLQRFGYCDYEEKKYVIYTDHVTIDGGKIWSRATYNVTLYSNIEYSCIILRAKALEHSSEELIESEEATTELDLETTTRSYGTDEESEPEEATTTKPSVTTCQPKPENPKLYLKRWCAGSTKICFGFQFIDLDFYVQINFKFSTVFTIAAYGQVGQVIDPLKAMEYANKLATPPIGEGGYKDVLDSLNENKNRDRSHRWFYKSDIGKR